MSTDYVTFNKTLSVPGLVMLGNLNMGANDIACGQVIASENSTFAGTVGVTGAVTLSSTLSAGATSVSTLASSGTATLNSVVCSNALSAGATSVSTLASSGTATLNAVVCSNALTAGATSVSTLASSGTATLNALACTGNSTVGGNETITGSLTAGASTLTSVNNCVMSRVSCPIPKNATDYGSLSTLATSGNYILIVASVESGIESHAVFLISKCTASSTSASISKLSENYAGASISCVWSASESPKLKWDSSVTYASGANVPCNVGYFSIA